MRGNGLLFLIVGAIVVVASAVLWLLPRAERLRAPTLAAAWVGVEVGGEGVARTGAIEMSAGQDFRLHAVLATEPRGGDEGGEPVYYSAVPRVEIDGRRYGHLIDPRTGWPVQGLLGVSVIAGQAVVAGSIASAALLQPAAAALRWLERSGAPYLAVDPELALHGHLRPQAP